MRLAGVFVRFLSLLTDRIKFLQKLFACVIGIKLNIIPNSICREKPNHPFGRQDLAADHHRQRDAVRDQADVELRDATAHPASAQLGDRAEVDEVHAHHGARNWPRPE